jgi:beta-glucosidase
MKKPLSLRISDFLFRMHYFVFVFGFLALPAFSQVYLDSTASVNARVDDLLSRMTLNEKLGQMVQTERNAAGVNSMISTYFLGSILSGGGSVPGSNTVSDWVNMYNSMQDAALGTRLGIPIIYGIDAVHGNNNVYGATIFPHNIGLGCTRDSLLVLECARATAEEVRATGLNWTFSPCIAVPRNIKWGRTYEGFGETPELQKMMAAASVYGYQGDTLGTPGGILACAKHYAGDGGTTNGTDRGNTEIDYMGLREVHLPGYVEAVKAGTGSVMVSYSSWNGVPCHTHKYLITDVLKGEMGFEGFVVSDWDAVNAIGGDYKTNIGTAVNAGIDMFMEPYTPVEFIDHLRSLVNAGTVPMSRIDDAVRRILAVKFRMHLFEHPYATTAQTGSLGSSEHRTLARRAVRESLVLLKNDNNMLPLSKTSGRILVTGSKANDIGSQCGGWTITWQGGTGAVTPGTSILTAVKAVRGNENVVFSATGTTTETVDVAVVVVGESPYAEGQGDNSNPKLTSADLTVISRVKQLNIPYVILLISGRPMILDNVLNDADAFVACWLPGTEAMGITDVLFGDYDFTGKLSHSWPSVISQEPLNWGDSNYQPLFPYGHGLSYGPAGVPSNDEKLFNFYPNPAGESIHIRSARPGTVEIFDAAGKMVLATETTRTTNQINISSLPDGMYVISLTNKDGIFRRKMMKG